MLSIASLIVAFFFHSGLKLAGLETPVILDTFFILLFVLCFTFDVYRSRLHSAIAGPLILGLLFRVFLLFFDLYGRNIYHLPNSGADSEGFYHSTVALANGYHYSTGNFPVMMSWLARLVGDERLFLQFVVVLFSIVTILFADKSLVWLEISVPSRRRVIWLMALLPNYAILSSIFLRESVVAMFLSIAVYFFVIWWTTGNELSFWLAVESCFGGALFHSGSVSVAVGMMAARVLSDRRKQTIHIKMKSLVPAILFLVLFAFLYTRYTENLFSKMETVESLEDIANTSTDGGSSYGRFVGNSSNPVVMLLFTPLRMAFFQFSPFFFQIRGLNDIIAMVFDSFFYMYVFFATLPYIRKKHLPNRTLIILLFVLGLASAFVFGWGVSNTGTALRHRNKMISIFAVQLALILDSRQIARRSV